MMRLWVITFIGVFLLSACESWLIAPEFIRPVSLPPDENLGQKNSIIYVNSEIGSNSNPGSKTQPLNTIQKCLDLVQPGDTCHIASGTYYESLVLKHSGTKTAPIIILGNGVVTINSGNSKTIQFTTRIHYYTFDSLRFISTATSSDHNFPTLDFASDFWDGDDPEGGLNGFTLRNCYVEGTIRFYGHNNIVENCEFNGRGMWDNGIMDKFAPSRDNIYRNNIVHDYRERGIWTMQSTDNILIEGNSVYNIIGKTGSPARGGIDCDGAGQPVTRCFVKNNIIYGTGTGIYFEQAFDSLGEGNIIYDVTDGMQIINYGPDINGEAEYRDHAINAIFRNNILYNTRNGIVCHSAPGGTAINNTIYNSTRNDNYYGAIALATPKIPFYCENWTLKNNIVAQNHQAAVWIEVPSPDSNINLDIDYNLFDFDNTSRKFHSLTYNPNRVDSDYDFSQWQRLGYDKNSILADPLFIDPTAGDFRLQPNSPACTAGDNGTYIGAIPCD